MSRRRAREMALQVLFQLDFNQNDSEAALDSVCQEREEVSEKARSYAEILVNGAKLHLKEIDEIISGLSSEWKLERMAGVDRNIARIAIFELNFGSEDLPPNVVINEAVELAKQYGSEESGRFVNGIIGSMIKNKAKQDKS